jgi:hypothetical protein
MLDTLRDTITRSFPELSNSAFTLLTAGWDCVAVDVDDRLIFKFPRNAAAEAPLRNEARVLAVVRPAVTMALPDLTIHPGPPLFSRHHKIKGDHLLAQHYDRLPNEARARLAAEMALFYAELHRLDARALQAAGAAPIKPWRRADDILPRVWPVLPPELRRFADEAVGVWQALTPDPYGTIFGFFDGHGWNMAFDHERGRLNGLYDFGDSGFGALHQEFIYSNWIARDLTSRIVTEYEALTGRALDRERIDLLTGIHRLSELADYADDPTHAPTMVQAVVSWASR